MRLLIDKDESYDRIVVSMNRIYVMFYGLEPDWCTSLLVEIPEASTENASERNGLLASKPVGIPPSMCLPNILSFY